MSNFVWDDGSLPGTKVDARPARGPANKEITAAEFNQLTTAVSDIRTAINYAGPAFDVVRYGAESGVESADAFQAALDAAGAYALANNGTRPVVRFNGLYPTNKPLYVPSFVTLQGDGKYASQLLPTNNFYGYNLIVAPDASTQGHGPFTAGCFNVSGQYTWVSYGSFDNDSHCYDLAQVPGGRLPNNASWTISFKFKPTSTPGDIVTIYGISGKLWANYWFPQLLLQYHPGTGFLINMRYGGQNFGDIAHFTSPVTYTGGTTYHFEISYDHANKKLRFFVDGQLWTAGALTLLSGGGGVSDGSGMFQYPWECNCIGPTALDNAISSNPTDGRQPGTLSEYHIKQGVRHTANFTPGTDAADNNTLLWVDFTEFYKGCIVGRAAGPTAKAYLYPTILGAVEMGGVTLKHFYMQRGSGILARFADGMWVEQIIQLYCEDGWRNLRNDFFSHFINSDIVAGTGRVGFVNQAGSYCTVDKCTFAAPVCMGFADANIAGTGNTLSIQAPYAAGLIIMGSGIVDLTLLSIDAEVNNTTMWLGAVVLAEPSNSTVTLRTPTLYSPTNKRTTDPIILAVNTNDVGSPSRIVLEQPYLFPPTAGPVIRNFLPSGSGTKNWVHPIQINNPTAVGLYSWTDTVDSTGASFVTDGNVTVLSDMTELQNPRLGTGAPGTGTWRKGNIVWNSNPTTGGNIGWVCTTAGSPGTWKAWGTIA